MVVQENRGLDDGDQQDNDEEDVLASMRGSLRLKWFDFNVDFHSSLPDIKDRRYEDIAKNYGEMTIDLRPYMQPRPFTVFQFDNLQKCLDQFRLMNLRQLPVLSEDDGSVVGIITRQDIFAFMSV